MEVCCNFTPKDNSTEAPTDTHALTGTVRDVLVRFFSWLLFTMNISTVQTLFLFKPTFWSPLFWFLPCFLVHAHGMPIDHDLSALRDVIALALRIAECRMGQAKRCKMLPPHQFEK